VNGLHQALERFALQVNGHAALRSTLAGWNPQFFIEARDSGDLYQVRIAQGQVQAVEPTRAEPDDLALLLRADAAVLQRVFDGQQSPLGAYTDGTLEVYGPPKDQIKLDVMALVLWGA
jgi:hypothetical protein